MDITLPTPSGPYSVGTKSFMVEDSSSHAFRGKGPNRWMVQAYYPSQPHTDKHSYMPGTLRDSKVGGVKVYAHAQVDSSFHEDSGRPLILFIPGLGGERQKYTILCEELASQGWAVFAFDTPYVSNFVRFEKGDATVLTFNDAWNVPRDRDYRYQYYDDAMRHVMGNVDYILSHLDSINNAQLPSTLDTSTVILMGHSFGGNVAHSFGFQDPRIKAVVDIDSKITERPINGQVGVPSNLSEKPVLFIRGNLQYQEGVGTQLSRIPNATIWTPDVQHSAFSDNGYLAGKIENFGRRNNLSDLYHWFFKTGPVWDNIDTDLGSYTVDEWYQMYTRYVVKWLETLK